MSDLAPSMLSLLQERNRREVEPFRNVFQACAAASADRRELMQAQAEIRTQVQIVLFEFLSPAFRAGEQDTHEAKYKLIKGVLESLNHQLSTR